MTHDELAAWKARREHIATQMAREIIRADAAREGSHFHADTTPTSVADRAIRITDALLRRLDNT